MATFPAALSLGDVLVRQLDGLFSLNDLHRAAGGEAKHEPNQFTRLDQTQALIAEIKSADSRNCIEARRGNNGGTYACRELVIAYAAWISAAFHLKVIRVFLASQAPEALAEATPLPAPSLTPAQAGEVFQRMAERFPNGADRPYAWSRFNKHFRLSTYKDLTANRYEEALTYIARIPERMPPALPAPEVPEAAAATAMVLTANSRWMAQVNPQGNGVGFFPCPLGAMVGTPAQLAAAIEAGEWSRQDVLLIVQAGVQRLSTQGSR